MRYRQVKLVRTQSSLRLSWGTDNLSVDHPAGSHKASGQRSSLALERQINQMLDTLEKHISASEQQQKVNDNTLSQIFTTLERLTSANSPTIAQTLGLSPSTSPAPQGSKPYLSNPTPTPELISVVSKVVSEARGRVGKKKGGPDDNSCKVSAAPNMKFASLLTITS